MKQFRNLFLFTSSWREVSWRLKKRNETIFVTFFNPEEVTEKIWKISKTPKISRWPKCCKGSFVPCSDCFNSNYAASCGFFGYATFFFDTFLPLQFILSTFHFWIWKGIFSRLDLDSNCFPFFLAFSFNLKSFLFFFGTVRLSLDFYFTK